MTTLLNATKARKTPFRGGCKTKDVRTHYHGRFERQKNAPAQGQGIVEARGITEEVSGARGGEEERARLLLYM